MKGIAINMVASIVIAVIALVVLWIFFSKLTPQITEWFYATLHKIKCAIIGGVPVIGWLSGC